MNNMDYSREYISMCENAFEIQNLAFQSKDILPIFVYDKTINRICIHFWCPETLCNDLSLPKSDPYLSVSIEHANDGNICHISDITVPYGGSAIWLPRQDQLQNMLSYTCPVYALCEEISQFAKDNEVIFDTASMEQVWLSYVMKEKHNKVWVGNEKKWKVG